MASGSLISAHGENGDDLSNVMPLPGGPVTGSPFTITTTPLTITFNFDGAIMFTVNTVSVHVRFFRPGETLVAAGLGDAQLPVNGATGAPLWCFPVRSGMSMSIRANSATSTVQMSMVRTN